MRHPLMLSLLLLTALPAGAETIAVTRFDDPIMDGCTPADCSLREAIAHASALAGHDAVQLLAGSYTLSEQGDRVTVDLDGEITVEGAGRSLTTIRAQGRGRLFNAHDADVTLRGMTLRYGNLPDGDAGGGGAMQLRIGRLALEDVLMRDNRAGRGGALHLTDASLDMVGSMLAWNAGSYGAAIHATRVDIRMSRGSGLVGNKSADRGGAMTGVDITLLAEDDSAIEFNGAQHGGAFSAHNLTVAGIPTRGGDGLLRIASNRARDSGYGGWGGAFFVSGTVTLDRVRIESNASDYAGGGIYASGADLTVRDSSVSGNVSSFHGGGATTYDGVVLLERVAISDNDAGDHGGALNLLGPQQATLRNVDVYGNSAPIHAAIRSAAALRMSHVTIWNNLSGAGRDALHVQAGSATYSNSILFGRCTRDSGTSSATGRNYRSLELTSPCSGNLGFASWLNRGLHGGAFEVSGIASASSPLVDGGSGLYCERSDIRGAVRGRLCDVGAFEFGASP